MNLSLLAGYYELIRFCQRNRMHDGDCMIFVNENVDHLVVCPVSISDDKLSESYYDEVMLLLRANGLRNIIRLREVNSSTFAQWLQQLESMNIEEGLHIFNYESDKLMVITKDGGISLGNYP
jgi:hypothetical protein